MHHQEWIKNYKLMQIKDNIFLVTGGSSGLGKYTAMTLCQLGGKVIITGRDKDKLTKVAEAIGAESLPCDVTDDKQIEAMFAAILQNYGRIDAVINNAGIGERAEVDELTRDAFRRIYEVNVFGAAMVGAQAAKVFKKQKHGTIVNIASTASLKGYASGSIYASSKFALRGLTQCWQAELRPYNVRVIQVNPSYVPTAFGTEDRAEKQLEENKLTPLEIAHTIISAIQMDDRGFIPEVTVFATNPF